MLYPISVILNRGLKTAAFLRWWGDAMCANAMVWQGKATRKWSAHHSISKRAHLFSIWHAAFLLTLMCTVIGVVAPVSASDIQGLRFGIIQKNDKQATRMVVETAQPAETKMILLEDPYRFVLDVSGGAWAVSSLPPEQLVETGAIQSYRFGYPQNGIGRIVLELSEPAIPKDIFTLPPAEGGHRLVVDLQAVSAAEFRASKLQVNRQTAAIQVPQILPQPVPKNTVRKQSSVQLSDSSSTARIAQTPSVPKQFIVAIDAGHGGKDPGAIGLQGTQEKHITLRAAKMLAEELQKRTALKPLLIRDEDTYYKLRERTRKAAQADADIFISLHADSAPNKKAHGISVFTLSEKASDKEAALLAKNENSSDSIGAADTTFEDPIVLDAFLGMRQRETKNESSRLANMMIENIKSFPGSDKRGHRFAGFAVLKSAEIPSVLVEMGFLSNRADEKNLNDNAYLRSLIQALVTAIEEYADNTNS